MHPIALLALLPAAALAIIVPTTPDSSGIYPSGTNCPIAWTADPDGIWDSFMIELMTGPNLPMVSLEVVATGLDGTTGGLTSFSYPCPTVDINAPIYFYQFTQPGYSNITWTTRFTIASSTGATVAAPEDADSVTPAPWGTGHLTGASAASATSIGALPAGAGSGSSTTPLGVAGASTTPSTTPIAQGNGGAAGGAAGTTAAGNGTPPGAAGGASTTGTGTFTPYSPGESAPASSGSAKSAARAELVLGWSDWALIAAAGWVGVLMM